MTTSILAHHCLFAAIIDLRLTFVTLITCKFYSSSCCLLGGWIVTLYLRDDGNLVDLFLSVVWLVLTCRAFASIRIETVFAYTTVETCSPEQATIINLP